MSAATVSFFLLLISLSFSAFFLLHLVLTYLTDVHGLDFAKSLLSVNAPLPSLVQLPKLRRARRLLDKLQVRILMYMPGK